MNYKDMLAVAFAEAQTGFDEGGVPVGAALFDADGKLLGRGRNRRVQDNDPSVHGETDAACIALMQRFIEQSPHIWFEDIGECDCA